MKCNNNTINGNKRICTNLTNIKMNGNYETMVSFKDLPPFKQLRKEGRKWNTIKNYSPVLERLILDIDNESLENALETTREIMQNELREYAPCINIYFSGNKGFHVEILTDELDIIDINAESAGDSCIPYKEFLNYFNNKYQDVDTKIHDAGARIIRKPNTKHEKSGKYKILINVNASLENVLNHAKQNKDMVEPCKSHLTNEQARNLLDIYNLPVETGTNIKELPITPISNTVYSDVFNALLKTGYHRHEIIGRLGASLNGYLSLEELEAVYQELVENTSIEDSINSHNSLIDAFENDSQPCNMGQLRNLYTDGDLDKSIPLITFNALSDYLKDKVNKQSYNNFTSKLKEYNNNWYKLLETELWDYVDNTENIFKGIIHGLGAILGEMRRLLIINGGSEVGKSEFQEKLSELLPNYIYVGSSTPASLQRKTDPYYFNHKIVGLSDKGLESVSDNSKQEIYGLWALFGQLVTDKKFIREIVDGSDVKEFKQFVEGFLLLYTQPYTNINGFKIGEQLKTRSTYITINPVKNGLDVILKKERYGTNKFYELHRQYIEYIIENPLRINITEKLITELYNSCNGSMRTYYYLSPLFKSYCQYLQIPNPTTEDMKEFLTIFKTNKSVTDIEFMVYSKLYKHLLPVKPDEATKLLTSWGVDTDYMLKSRNTRKSSSLFTSTKIKTIFRTDFIMNKNLKDIIDSIPEILDVLWKNGYLERLDHKYNNENVYYLPYNPDMEK